MVDPTFCWGVQRPEAGNGEPFLLSHAFFDRAGALAWILDQYGSHPNREAALKRHRREGIRAVRVAVVRAEDFIFDPQTVADKPCDTGVCGGNRSKTAGRGG